MVKSIEEKKAQIRELSQLKTVVPAETEGATEFNEQTSYKLFVDLDGLKSKVITVMYNDNYKSGKFNETVMGDNIDLQLDDEYNIRKKKALETAKQERDRALSAIKTKTLDLSKLTEF